MTQFVSMKKRIMENGIDEQGMSGWYFNANPFVSFEL